MSSNNKNTESRGFLKKALNEKGIVTRVVLNIGNKINSLTEKIEKSDRKLLEIIVLVLFLTGQIGMAFFHEPGADEAMPWLVAKDASIYDMFFTVPHYNRGISLWNYVLIPFAKLGTPYELTLNFLNFIFVFLAVILLVFKAPFRRIIRLLCPFSFFVFYQYGIINEGYSMIMLAFVLLALSYKKRNEKPLLFATSLIFLGSCGVFATVFSVGISITWLIDIVKHVYNQKIKYSFKLNKCVLALLVLIYLSFIVFSLIPADDSFIKQQAYLGGYPLYKRWAYTFFGCLSDIFATNIFFENGNLAMTTMDIREFIAGIAIGVFIWVLCIRQSYKNKTLIWYLIPMVIFSITAGLITFSRQNIGVVALFLLFWYWIVNEDQIGHKTPFETKDNNIQENESIVRALGHIIISLIVIVNLYWCISSCVLDVLEHYSFGRAEYTCLKENGLVDKDILVRWEENIPRLDDGPEAITYSQMVLELAPYLDESLNSFNIMNSVYALGRDYGRFGQIPLGSETFSLKKQLANRNIPSAIVGTAAFMSIYTPVQVNLKNYEVVLDIEAGNIWKGVPETHEEKIYMLKDTLIH